jgi:branched-subunit amino acid ABC-type transport system permease component
MVDLLQQILNGLVIGSVYALVALGLTLIYGILYIPNFDDLVKSQRAKIGLKFS